MHCPYVRYRGKHLHSGVLNIGLKGPLQSIMSYHVFKKKGRDFGFVSVGVFFFVYIMCNCIQEKLILIGGKSIQTKTPSSY